MNQQIGTQVNNTYVVVNAFGAEDLEDPKTGFVGREALAEILITANSAKGVEGKLVELIWANPDQPQNRTVMTVNVKDRSRLQVSRGEGRWEVVPAAPIVGKMRDRVLTKYGHARYFTGTHSARATDYLDELHTSADRGAYYGAAAANAHAHKAAGGNRAAIKDK